MLYLNVVKELNFFLEKLILIKLYIITTFLDPK